MAESRCSSMQVKIRPPSISNSNLFGDCIHFISSSFAVRESVVIYRQENTRYFIRTVCYRYWRAFQFISNHTGSLRATSVLKRTLESKKKF